MTLSEEQRASIIERIEDLPSDKIQQVIDFIDFLKIKKEEAADSSDAALIVQQNSLSKIWESETEDLYDL